VALAVLAGACGEDEGGLPEGCRAAPKAILSALDSAPRPVTLAGTRLSECLTRAGSPGDLARIGTAWVDAAARLAERARREPRGHAATSLGYLIGAARDGASRTQGIHDELLRRLEQELAPVDTSAPAFRRGLRAGRRHG
jgi:hypothetical protein